MKNFACSRCQAQIYFESTSCVACGSAIGFHPASLGMVNLDAGRPKTRRGSGVAQPFAFCANASHGVCNWLLPQQQSTGLCLACDMNRTIPNLAEPGSLEAWRKLERAKKRVVYSLLRFKLPLAGEGSGTGRLTFDFARNTLTGHLDGVITVDIREADAVERERQRQRFHEPYRSLLGHLRHECGHFYWTVLVERAGRLDDFRAHFGDERVDYGAALAQHRQAGPASDWQSRHVSAYASAHPWEDWAETWAHYLNMVDALDTAEGSGMETRSAGMVLGMLWPFKPDDPYRDPSFQALKARWVPLSIALNSMSRSMGHDDFYPFVISGAAYEKLAFVHELIRQFKA